MKKIYLSALFLSAAAGVFAQDFEKQLNIQSDYLAPTVTMPASPLVITPLFIGGVDQVQTADGPATAKEWHDFIGITPDPANADQFWLSVNHEMISADPLIGDGGGMTAFKIRQNADGSVTVLPQTLQDGRSGEFFNVDFKNTVGETGMNCGGISAPDGRIWTAEEWFRSNNKSLKPGITDTTDFIIGTTTPNGFPGFNDETIKKYQNFNYMVEIDPKQAKAVRKQYNWGRQPFEGGAVMADNKTVYLGADDTPGYFTKFVADVAGDFTAGKLYVFKQDAATNWVEIDNTLLENMLNFGDMAAAAGATMFCRLEWVAVDPVSGDVFMTETGSDNLGNAWPADGIVADHHVARAASMGVAGPRDAAYKDYYGRVLRYDVETGEISVHIEGGPAYSSSNGAAPAHYPSNHLSNPDGLSFITVGGTTYMMICEDLNGTSYNRMPYGMNKARCELFFLDMSIANPSPSDLIRITTSANGAEITGVAATPNGKTLFVNSQHPDASEDVNNAPYNHSLTLAIHGLEEAITGAVAPAQNARSADGFSIYPNPTTREIHFNKVTDAALYDAMGKRVKVVRNNNLMDVYGLTPGKYIIKTKDNEVTSLIVQ